MHDMPAEERMQFPGTFTLAEAAWVAEASDKLVRQEVDAHVVQVTQSPGRHLARWDVLYISAVRDVAAGLSVELRKTIYQAVREALIRGSDRRLVFGAFELRFDSLKVALNRREAELAEIRASIETKSGVRGGNLVIRGTRIPVRLIASLHGGGVSLRDLAKEYEVDERRLYLAVQYCLLHPRRGRPSRALSDLGRASRSDIVELGSIGKL
jgi:uncharacterized protein (DUF433 family)